MRKLSSLLLCLTLAIGFVVLTGCPRPEEPVDDFEPMPEAYEEPVFVPEPTPTPFYDDDELLPEDELPPPEDELPPPGDDDGEEY